MEHSHGAGQRPRRIAAQDFMPDWKDRNIFLCIQLLLNPQMMVEVVIGGKEYFALRHLFFKVIELTNSDALEANRKPDLPARFFLSSVWRDQAC